MESQNWFMKNISKITLVLAAIGAVSGVTALIVGSVAVHQTQQNKYKSFLMPDGTVIFGDSIIWWNKVISPNKTDLYFAWKPINIDDVEWDGTYTPGYFEN